MPVGLGQNPFDASSKEHTAYEGCLMLEGSGDIWDEMTDSAQRQSISEIPKSKFTPKIVARTLGYSLIHAPSDTGKACLAREINSCAGDGDLASLAYTYFAGLFRIFRHSNSSISTPLTPHSPHLFSEFNQPQSSIPTLLSHPTKSSCDAKTLALARDDYRCIMSRSLDAISFTEDPARHIPPEPVVNTQLAHIFSESEMNKISGFTTSGKTKRAWAASVSTIVEHFAGISLAEELNQNVIHRPENTFTITAGVRWFFDTLWFSLHPIGPDDGNTYEIYTYPPGRHDLLQLPNEVMFKDASGDGIPLPSRRYLALHDACANIAHLSGAGDVMDQILQELEELKVMATDGGSKDLLLYALTFHLDQLSTQQG